MRSLVLEDVVIVRRGETAPLIDGLSASIGPGEILTVMGASGTGKSTLLALIAGFIDRHAFQVAGRVVLDGRPLDHLPAEARHLGLLFQDAVLFPHLSVGGNLRFGLPRTAYPTRRARVEAAAQALADAGLDSFEHRDPATLSGGQQARVALLRTLLANPQALLLDEPFGKLDRALRDEFRAQVFARARSLGLPTLLVSHDPADAQAAAGPIVSLDRS